MYPPEANIAENVIVVMDMDTCPRLSVGYRRLRFTQ